MRNAVVEDTYSHVVYTEENAPLGEALDRFCKKKIIPFDVPGHKRGKGNPELAKLLGEKTLSMDINSLPEMDNLNHPNGVILASEKLFASAFGSDYAFFTVNGTTLAVQVMIHSACNPGDKILLPRNIHKSAMNAMILADLNPVYMQAEVADEFGFVTGVTFETAKKTMDDNPDAKAIFLINPTYYGVCSELERIVEYAHSKDMCVLVDEAHGAHFAFHKDLPVSAMDAGADMSACSIHKTGGAMTQASAVLLKGERISHSRVKEMLGIFHTTSPSYMLMSSLDVARKNLCSNGEKIFDELLPLVRKTRDVINNTPGLKALDKSYIGNPGMYDFDETKLTINVSGLGLTGFAVYNLMYCDYNIQLELSDVNNVLAIISLGDDEKSLKALEDAFVDLSRRFYSEDNGLEHAMIPLMNPKLNMSPRNAYYSEKEKVSIRKCAGRTCAEAIMVYPPGIPILTPGEEISEEIIDYLIYLKGQNSKLTDLHDSSVKTLLVVKE